MAHDAQLPARREAGPPRRPAGGSRGADRGEYAGAGVIRQRHVRDHVRQLGSGGQHFHQALARLGLAEVLGELRPAKVGVDTDDVLARQREHRREARSDRALPLVRHGTRDGDDLAGGADLRKLEIGAQHVERLEHCMVARNVLPSRRTRSAPG